MPVLLFCPGVIMKTEIFFRCGWCGTPVDENGVPLDEEKLKGWDEEKAEDIQGVCCMKEAYQIFNDSLKDYCLYDDKHKAS